MSTTLNLKSDEKTISDDDGEMRIQTQQLPAMKAFALLARLAKAIGPALGALMRLDPQAELSAAASIDGLSAAFTDLDDVVVAKLVPDILTQTSAIIDGKQFDFARKENIDLVFSGRLPLMFQTIGFALQVNYRNFSLGSLLGAPQAARVVS